RSMNCEHFNNLLSAYIDGELSKRQTRKVEAHLTQCGRCMEDVAELRRVRALLKSSYSGEPAPGFWIETIQRAQTISVPQPVRPHPAFRAPVRAATTLAVLAAGCILVSQFPRREPRPLRTIDPAQLVLWHADLRTDLPLADSGSMRYVFTDMRTN